MSQEPGAEDPNGAVGYARPPKQHQIKPKEVRNPYGRKGKPRPDIDFLEEPFELGFDGKKVRTTRDRAVDFALFNAAMKGNVSAAKELKSRHRERAAVGANKVDTEALRAEDEAALNRMIERKWKDRTAGGGEHVSSSPSASTSPAADGAEQ